MSSENILTKISSKSRISVIITQYFWNSNVLEKKKNTPPLCVNLYMTVNTGKKFSCHLQSPKGKKESKPK